jgi:hypothetical protein
MKANVTKHGKLLGGCMPRGVVDGVRAWIAAAPERDISTFIRQAAREKLARDGIQFQEANRDCLTH